MRNFEVWHYGRLLGKVRALSAENAFKNAAKKWNHLNSAEFELQDPKVIRIGNGVKIAA